MAIDYKRYLQQAQQAGQMGSLTPEQMQTAMVNPEYGMGSLRVQGSMDGAKTPEQKLLAQTTMQQLQSSYAPVLNMQGKPIRWEGENAYQQMLNNYLNRGPFTYDPSKDAGFSAYKKAMLREGDRAQENALGKTAAMTGGVPSSWAVTAAGQAGNYHASKIADALPNFRQIALQNYLQEGQQDLKDLQVLGGERDFAYKQILQNFKQALDLWNSGHRTPEIAEIIGEKWDPSMAAGPSRGGGKPGAGVIEKYVALKQAGVPSRELDAALRDAIQKGEISQKDATELRSSGYGGMWKG